jgi:AraC-like DNA-binding protein
MKGGGMPDRVQEAVASVRGVLRPEGAAGRFTLARHEAQADLAPLVDYYWIVRWDLTGQPPYEQSILPHPNVHLAFEDFGVHVYGIDTKIFSRRLTGAGKVLGVRFRPGCFRPFSPAPVFTLNDRVVPAVTILGPGIARANEAIMAAATDEDMIAIAAGAVRAVAPPHDGVAEQVAAMVERITSDLALRRVGDLTAAFGLTERKLQRLFSEYVGVSPKWVIRRARLHEAALRASSGETVDWATLARDLGYADQSHLTRDFTATIGTPPARYTASA